MRALFSVLLVTALAAYSAGESREPASEAEAEVSPAPVASQTRGFVLVDFSFDQPESEPGGCPQGLNRNERDRYADRLARHDPVAAAQVPAGFDYIIADRKLGGIDPCVDPAHFEDADHLSFEGPAISQGFDLDGVSSTRDAAAASACPHDDFAGPDGAGGVDNQLWRVLGCIEGYQRGNTIDEFSATNIRDGARTILVRVSGIDDERDDPEVEVGLFSGVDPILVDVNGDWLKGASLSATDDRRYRNQLSGRIVNGVVLAGPQDVRLDFDGQFLDSEFPLRDARLRLEFLPDGNMRGWLSGFWDVERFYDTYARQATRLGAFTVGFRCPAMYHSLLSHADAYPDDSGACTAISTVFRMAGIPAFVILPEASATLAASSSPAAAKP